MLRSIISIGFGASLGALARWLVSVQLNGLFPLIPPGTLAVNLVGGFLVGIAVAFFANHPSISPYWRLITVTGFLGGLTTFSSFSGETTRLLEDGSVTWAPASIGAHVVGSLAMTLLGIFVVNFVRDSFIESGA